MIFLTFITIVFIPPSVVGGTMGINVEVPAQSVESLVPFYVVCSIILFAMTVIYVALNYQIKKFKRKIGGVKTGR